ncbi:MAG: sarcosine oxidase subunit gamma family protein [Pedococcus sp.]
MASAATELEALPAGVRVRELPLLVQLDLRLDPTGPAAAAVAAVLGVAVPQDACTAVTAGDVSILWLGPDEWLVVAPAERTDLLESLDAAVAGQGAVVDVSAQRTTISLSGPKARDLLSHGCSTDLHPRVALRGTCVQTLLALAGVVLVVRNDTATDFWILVRSSFARYLADWIVDACTEYQQDPSWH